MPVTIDYYLAPQSPWTYLGHARFTAIARAAGAVVNVRPADYGRIFPASGGLPLAKRAPQRQAYRLVELRRFSEHLGVPMHLKPRHFPVAADPASKLILAVDLADGADAAMDLTGRVLRACWAEERDIADANTLRSVLGEAGLPAARWEAAAGETVQQRYDQTTQQALEAGVFGAPSYVVEGEIFWGQDRLDFLARRLGVNVPAT
jgi:2-hydroxychromene-2-carboxylate isomerase